MAFHLSSTLFASPQSLRLLVIFALCGALSGCNDMGDEIAHYAKARKAAKERSVSDARQKALVRSVGRQSPGELVEPSNLNAARILTEVEEPRPVKITRLREPGIETTSLASGASGFVLPIVIAADENLISREMTGSVKKVTSPEQR